jgi:hypothetical protein
LFPSSLHAVGDGVEQAGRAHALTLVVDDECGAVTVMSGVAEFDLLAAQVDGVS